LVDDDCVCAISDDIGLRLYTATRATLLLLVFVAEWRRI